MTQRSSGVAAHRGAPRILVIKSNVEDGAIPESPDDALWKKYWSKSGGALRKLDHLDDEVGAISDAASGRGNAPHVLPEAHRIGGPRWSLADETQTALQTWGAFRASVSGGKNPVPAGKPEIPVPGGDGGGATGEETKILAALSRSRRTTRSAR